jgi:hypothetical protein
MGFVKNKGEGKIERFKSFLEAREVFEDNTKDKDERLSALEYIVEHKEIFYVLDMLSKLFSENNPNDNVYIEAAFAGFRIKPKREEDFNALFNMLKSDNAYLRNATIKFLQEYGKEAKEFIQKLMENEDRDIRIFAINILGDVKFEDSLEMLRHFIVKEEDINALMTAVDYLGEIGEESDIKLLEAIKKEKNDPYVSFGVDLAVSRIRSEND